jgi:hypothetical protein
MTNRTNRALFLILTLVLAGACGGSDTTGPARARFASSLTGTKCVNPAVKDTVTRYNLTANWQATAGTWQAVFASITTLSDTTVIGHGATISEASAVNANQSKTSSCVFLARTQVYAILDPVTVAADADITPTITLP